MSHKLRVHNMAMSLDGYAVGPDQGLDDPLGVGGTGLHEWVFKTSTGHEMMGTEGGDTGIDDDYLAQGLPASAPRSWGATCSALCEGRGRTRRGRGWWGDNPPYHRPVFVLTHHPRSPIAMEGGTTFNFVDDGIGVSAGAGLRRSRRSRRQTRRGRIDGTPISPGSVGRRAPCRDSADSLRFWRTTLWGPRRCRFRV